MVSLRSYTDQRITDLTRYHDATVTALQEEIDRRLSVMTEAVDQRFAVMGEQTAGAATALDARLERMNEFRDAMKDQAARMVDTDLFKALADRVDNVERALDRQRGRMTVYASLSGVVLVLIAIATLIINHVRL